ncbi:MAG: Indole-3-glycerol-phosphate synthase [Hyphomonadaceae bacterium]|nr:MAG: Indole-3-glycerol-phosphate synthase [Hyphomonadaceae bacterium]
MNAVPDILRDIIAYKSGEVSALKAKKPLAELEQAAKNAPKPRGFMRALLNKPIGEFGLIAEIKKASPSKGVIRTDFDPAELAMAYNLGGATCLSVLTDGPSFQGQEADLIAAREAVNMPIIRKDFMIDVHQMFESRAIGADAILIIMACLEDELAQELFLAAQNLGMDALIEVHNKIELERALKIGGKMIGVNNRDLHSFNIDLATTERLAKLLPKDTLLVAESGIYTHADMQRMQNCGARGFLVGESLMRQNDVAKATKTLLEG